MADLFIKPGSLRGRVVPPPSKSDAHRALFAAGLAGCGDRVEGLPAVESEDITATRRCLAALTAGQSNLDCAESGTLLRFLIPVAAALGASASQPVVFSGHGRLPLRPLDEYRDILSMHGVRLSFPPGAFLPLTMQGRLTGGVFRVPGHISSQYISGLLFALPLVADDSSIELTSPLESAPYVEMTLRTLRAFGIQVAEVPGGYRVPGGQRYQPADYCVEKDYSQAAFWLTAAFAGSTLVVEGLEADSAQGDKAIIGLLAEFARIRAQAAADPLIRAQAAADPLIRVQAAADPLIRAQAAADPLIRAQAAADPLIRAQAAADPLIRAQAAADPLIRTAASDGAEWAIDVSDTPDLVPILAVAAALTPATTRIVKAARLRLKETDRLQTTCAALAAIGGDITQTGDELLIRGGRPLKGGTVDATGDHRIAMAFAIAALSTTGGVRLHGAESVNKSYPDFFREFRRLGGDLNELHMGTESENQLIW